MHPVTILAHQPQMHVYDQEPSHMNGLNDQEVPREDHQYEEINGNHGDDVVDLQHGMQNGHVDVAPQQMPQQVRLTVNHNTRCRPLLNQYICILMILLTIILKI